MKPGIVRHFKRKINVHLFCCRLPQWWAKGMSINVRIAINTCRWVMSTSKKVLCQSISPAVEFLETPNAYETYALAQSLEPLHLPFVTYSSVVVFFRYENRVQAVWKLGELHFVPILRLLQHHPQPTRRLCQARHGGLQRHSTALLYPQTWPTQHMWLRRYHSALRLRPTQPMPPK